jgi:hypothetical protein
MIEFDLPSRFSTSKVAELLALEVGPRKYWIHHEVGGVGWKIQLRERKIILDDEYEELASFITLKFS